MYYNNKFKIINITLATITILTAIISIAKHNLKMAMPTMLILLSLQRLLMGVNSLKLHKKTEYILSISASIFIFLCSIISIKLMIS